MTGVAPEAIAPVGFGGRRGDQPIAEVHSHRSALVLLALLAVIWGVHWVIVKVGLGYVPPITYAASRVAIALVLMTAFLGARGRLRRPDRGNLSIILSIGVAQVAAGVVLQNLALQVVDAGRSSVLVYTMPLWVAVILVVGFRIRPSAPSCRAGPRHRRPGPPAQPRPRSTGASPASSPGRSGCCSTRSCGRPSRSTSVATAGRSRRSTCSRGSCSSRSSRSRSLAVGVERGEGIRWEPASLLFLLYSGVLATAFASWATQAITRSLGPQASATGFLAIPVVGLLSGWLILGETLGPLDLLGSRSCWRRRGHAMVPKR